MFYIAAVKVSAYGGKAKCMQSTRGLALTAEAWRRLVHADMGASNDIFCELLAYYPTAAWIVMLVFMPSRGSAPALRRRVKLCDPARYSSDRQTRTDEAGYRSHLANTIADTFAESHSATALMTAEMLVMAAATFDLLDGVVSENPLLFVAGVLFSCSGVLLFALWKQNPRRVV
jgi:hypothetical protein